MTRYIRIALVLLALCMQIACGGSGKLIGKYPKSQTSTIGVGTSTITTTETWCELVYESTNEAGERTQYTTRAGIEVCE